MTLTSTEYYRNQVDRDPILLEEIRQEWKTLIEKRFPESVTVTLPINEWTSQNLLVTTTNGYAISLAVGSCSYSCSGKCEIAFFDSQNNRLVSPFAPDSVLGWQTLDDIGVWIEKFLAENHGLYRRDAFPEYPEDYWDWDEDARDDWIRIVLATMTIATSLKE